MKRLLIIFFIVASMTVLGQEVQLSITDKAITEMQNENYAKAILLFNKAILSNPKDKEALQYRAYTKFKQKNYASALLDINKAIIIDDLCAECLEIRADLKYKMKDLKGCIKDYEKAIEMKPNIANGDNYYLVAKSKLVTKPKPSLGIFLPSANFIEKIITTKLNATDFYNQYYDNIVTFSDEDALTYNSVTKNHDIPRYTAELVCNYKAAKIYITLISKTKNDPITNVSVTVNCVCEWFSNWKNIQTNGFVESKRLDENGNLEIWGEKQNLKTKYSLYLRNIEKRIIMWTE